MKVFTGVQEKFIKGLTGINDLVQEICSKLLLLTIIESSIVNTFDIYPLKNIKMACNWAKMQLDK